MFAGAPHLGHAEGILAVVHGQLSPRVLIGCGAGGVVGGGREIEEGAGAVVWALSAPDATIEPRELTTAPVDDGIALGGLPEDPADYGEAMLVLADPNTFSADALLLHLNDERPAMPVLGGLASAAAEGSASLFLNGQVVDSGAVACSLSGIELLPCVSQGAAPVGPEMTVTGVEGNLISELASKPALERLREAIEELEPDERDLAAEGLLLGVVIDENQPDYERGDFLVRPIVGVDPESGGARVRRPGQGRPDGAPARARLGLGHRRPARGARRPGRSARPSRRRGRAALHLQRPRRAHVRPPGSRRRRAGRGVRRAGGRVLLRRRDRPGRRPQLPARLHGNDGRVPASVNRAALAVAGLVVAAAIAFVLLAGDDDPATRVERAAAPPGAPNLLVVMTDDQSLRSFNPDVMPRTTEFFEREGTMFEQAIAAPPLCCPSRAGFITGRYAHNHGVVENDIGYGSMSGEDTTFPVALQAGGYRTGMIGKFLNGYERVAGAEPAPGFDRWYAINGSADYFDFQVSDDGKLREVGEYATDDLTREAIEFTADARTDESRSSSGSPTTRPTRSSREARPRATGLRPSPRTPRRSRPSPTRRCPPRRRSTRTPRDKPSLAGGPGEMRRGRVAEATRAWRCALAAMAAVDEQVGALIESLEGSGQLDETVVVYLSDNGHFYGEHRLSDDKRLPLDPALRIPLAISVGDELGGPRPPDSVPDLVSQVDLASTLLDYAGVGGCPADAECPPMDGRSLRGLLEGEGPWPADRAIPLELDDGWTYRALRTAAELYVELDASRWADFDEPALELYDLERDPHQLENVAGDPGRGGRVAELHARLEVLGRCAGIEGRDPAGDRPHCE